MNDNQQKKVLLRLPIEMADYIDNLAKKRLRGLNNQILVLIKLGIASDKEENKALAEADQIIAESNNSNV